MFIPTPFELVSGDSGVPLLRARATVSTSFLAVSTGVTGGHSHLAKPVGRLSEPLTHLHREVFGIAFVSSAIWVSLLSAFKRLHVLPSVSVGLLRLLASLPETTAYCRSGFVESKFNPPNPSILSPSPLGCLCESDYLYSLIGDCNQGLYSSNRARSTIHKLTVLNINSKFLMNGEEAHGNNGVPETVVVGGVDSISFMAIFAGHFVTACFSSLRLDIFSAARPTGHAGFTDFNVTTNAVGAPGAYRWWSGLQVAAQDKVFE